MKKTIETIARLIFVLVLLSVGLACNMGKKDKRGSSENNSAPTPSTNKASDVYIEADTWRNWAPPKTLSGYTLVRFVTDPFKLEGLSSANARYETGEKWIDIQLIDGSTEKGKREMRDHIGIAELERDHSNQYGYEKTLVRNGIKAKEKYLAPPAGQYLIKFMLEEHYGVSVKSNAETAEEIWAFIDGLDLKGFNTKPL